jgi:CotS family spore coat protein
LLKLIFHPSICVHKLSTPFILWWWKKEPSAKGGMNVNERGLKVLEQYDLQILSTRRGRGSFLCETDQGLKLLTETGSLDSRLRFQNRVFEHLHTSGYPLVDRILKNREGDLVTKDRDGTRYLVKDWFEGRECDTRNREDILRAVEHLAKLHKMLHLPEDGRKDETEQETCPVFYGEPIEESFVSHTREIRKTWNYMRRRRRKNAFESCFLNHYEMFLEQANEAMDQLEDSSCGKLYEDMTKQGWLCHGDYNQHMVLYTKEGIATTNFHKCCLDVQVCDLYQFLRKILEKQEWDVRLGLSMVETYDRVHGLDAGSREYLKIRLAYPEKFWKLANHYYNHNKAWIPGKTVEKLQILADQQWKKAQFLREL